MPKVKIDRCDYYPFYEIDADFGKEVEITEEQLRRWRNVIADMNCIQVEFEELWEADNL